MSEPYRIAIDFDGTVVEHDHPHIGAPIEGAIEVIKEIIAAGWEVCLWTCRSGHYIDEAVAYLKGAGVVMAFVNEDPKAPMGSPWHVSPGVSVPVGPKLFYTYLICDRNLGCPMKWNKAKTRKVVDWKAIRKMLVKAGILPK